MPVQKSTDNPLGAWDQLRYALALSRHATLSAAARVLGVDHTTMARRIEALEHALGRPAFERTQDGFTLTPLGATIIAAAERMEAELQSLARRIDGADPALTGRVRLTTTGYFAAQLFAPALAAFRHAHPGLDIELIAENRNLDLSRREADLALRMSRPDAPGLVARRLAQVGFACYAAATDPRPFAEQDFLAYDDSMANARVQRFLLSLIPESRIVLRANVLQSLIQAARAGLGATMLPCLAGEREPGLRRVPTPRAMPPADFWLLFHQDLRRSPRLRAAIGLVESVIATHRAALLPAGFPFDPVQEGSKQEPLF